MDQRLLLWRPFCKIISCKPTIFGLPRNWALNFVPFCSFIEYKRLSLTSRHDFQLTQIHGKWSVFDLDIFVDSERCTKKIHGPFKIPNNQIANEQISFIQEQTLSTFALLDRSLPCFQKDIAFQQWSHSTSIVTLTYIFGSTHICDYWKKYAQHPILWHWKIQRCIHSRWLTNRGKYL